MDSTLNGLVHSRKFWLAVVALALIVVGAFSLFLALTRGQW